MKGTTVYSPMQSTAWEEVPVTSNGVPIDIDDTEVKRFPNLSLTIPRIRTPARFGRVGTLVVTKRRLLFLMYGYSFAYSLPFTKLASQHSSAYAGRPQLGWLECVTQNEIFSIQGPANVINDLQQTIPASGAPAGPRRVVRVGTGLSAGGGHSNLGVAAVVQRNDEQVEMRRKKINDVTSLDDLRRSATELINIANILANTADVESGQELGKISAQICLKKRQGNETRATQSGVAGLAQEFAADIERFFKQQNQKILSLPEAFALYNRLRSDALMPKEIAAAVKYIQKEDRFPVRVEDLGKVRYLVAKDASFEQTIRSLVAELRDDQSITPMAFAKRCGIPVSMARDYLIRAEAQGLVARDDSLFGLCFFKNLFPIFLDSLSTKK
jgi:hypothetical protein